MKMKKKAVKTIGITAGVIAAVGAGVTAICLSLFTKLKVHVAFKFSALYKVNYP